MTINCFVVRLSSLVLYSSTIETGRVVFYWKRCRKTQNSIFCDDKKFYFSFEMFWHVWHESVAWNRNPPVPFKLVYRSVNVTIKLIYWNCLSFTVWRSLPDTTKEMEVLQIFVKLVNSAAANISPVIPQYFQSPPNHISSWFKAELSGQNCSISRPRCHAKGKY